MALIAASMLAADFARLGEALKTFTALGASMIHIDVSDGHFDPEISVGQPVVRSIRNATETELDVHLMIERPERFIEDFVNAGADRLAFHVEAIPDMFRAVALVKNCGAKVGLALNPGTPVETVFEVLEELDFLLILTAVSGRGQERFIRRTMNKVGAAARERDKRGLHVAIEAEGGIGAEEANELARAGADILVVGSAIFGSSERGEIIRRLVSTTNPDVPGGSWNTKPRVQ